MSVIVTGMEIPQSCADCECNYDFIGCSITNESLDYETLDNKRLDTCPLKFVEGLIDEIEQLYLDDGAIQEYSKDEIIDLIERYCEVNEDEK